MQSIDNDVDTMQVSVCNIHWSNPRSRRRSEDLPSEMALSIPKKTLAEAKKTKTSIADAIETFCCNVLTAKFGAEVHSCQIWLPLE